MPAIGRATVPTPLGDLSIVCTARGVAATCFVGDEPDPELDRVERSIDELVVDRPDDAGLARRVAATAKREAAAFFAGRSLRLSVPPDLALVPEGFGRRVLEVVATIPPGELWTYGDVAGMAGSPRAARAAGSALAGCPIELFVPCHRVVHAGGTLGGYGRHEERKRWLIRHEAGIAGLAAP